MFPAETLASRGGGAARHGARWLLLPPTVGDAMFKSLHCIGSASIKLALSLRTMLGAKTAFNNSSITTFHLALFLGVHVLGTPSSRLSGRVAPFPRAEPAGTVSEAETTSHSTVIAPFSSADPICAVFHAKPFSSRIAGAA